MSILNNGLIKSIKNKLTSKLNLGYDVEIVDHKSIAIPATTLLTVLDIQEPCVLELFEIGTLGTLALNAPVRMYAYDKDGSEVAMLMHLYGGGKYTATMERVFQSKSKMWESLNYDTTSNFYLIGFGLTPMAFPHGVKITIENIESSETNYTASAILRKFL